MKKAINIPLEGNEAPAMRLGIVLTRLERNEVINNYPFSKFEADRIDEMMKHFEGYIWTLTKVCEYWSFFNARIIHKQSKN